ncbi:DUF2442 domain-containing protein [bacterium]|nr:DUF2442 domain-containing protein [bacterium]
MTPIWINKAEYVGNYRLLLNFNTGEKKVFDGKEYILSHPLFEALKDINNYKNFELDGWTVSWQNGSLDIAPEYLYETATTA